MGVRFLTMASVMSEGRLTHLRRFVRIMSVLLLVLGAMAAARAAQGYPPLCVEITPAHPLLIFQTGDFGVQEPDAHVLKTMRAWATLPENLKPFSALQIDVRADEASSRQVRYDMLLTELQQAEIPVVITLADGDPKRTYPLDLAEQLVAKFTCIKGLQVSGLAFNEYYRFTGGQEYATPPNVRWLITAIDLAARYGRFVAIHLDEVNWPRVMCNTLSKPLYTKMRECRDYVVPVVAHRGPHTVTQTSVVLGLWLEGGVSQWGIGATSKWFSDAAFLKPGVFGAGANSQTAPSYVYRAMILNGAMTGACAYSFGPGDDLWFAEGTRHWSEAIEPTLSEIIDRGYIAPENLIIKKAAVAYQLAEAGTTEDFHLNLRDIDPVLDQGFLIQGAYGVERAGQIPELIPNSGRHYWVPILSPYAPQPVLDLFAKIVRPGEMSSGAAWTELLDKFYQPDGSGTAFVSRIGRAVFIMNTRENLYEEQTMRVPELPTPVRGLQAQRQGEGVVLTWPLREGDVAYKVYKRVLPDGAFTLVAKDVDAQTWTDPSVPAADLVAYAVSALTTEMEPCEKAVNLGDYLALSVVESRLDEEAAITPLLSRSVGQPLARPQDTRPKSQTWWPSVEGLTEAQAEVARSIAQRIEEWDAAFSKEDLDAVMAVYAEDYADLEGWQSQYVRRAFQWFFERHVFCRMHRQVRQWDFGPYETSGQVRVLLYSRFTGVAMTDPSGRIADVVASFPRSFSGETWITFAGRDGTWRIVCTDPALPNFNDILSFSSGPYDSFSPGPDVYKP